MGDRMDISYTLPNSWTNAQRRFELLEQCYDPATCRRITDLGIRSGWNCLEAGAGAGSVARWLAGQVGERGGVPAVDLDVALLDVDTASNLEVQQRDLCVDELP